MIGLGGHDSRFLLQLGPPQNGNTLFDCAQCPAFPQPSAIPITTGTLIILGLIISYSFQIMSFVRLQSSKGMSSFSLGLGTLSSLLTFINFMILHWSTLVCCACVEAGPCITANLTPLQLFVNALCNLLVYNAFLWYFPMEPYSIFRDLRKKEYKQAQILLGIALFFSCVFAAVGAFLYYGMNLSENTLAVFGKTVGIISAIVVIIQWTPQIFTTFQLGSAGSLSIVMLTIQLPGCLVTVFFQAIIGGADATTWVPYLITAINIAILIIMCVVFWIRNRGKPVEDNFDIILSEDEHLVYEYDDEVGALARKSYGALNTAQTQVGNHYGFNDPWLKFSTPASNVPVGSAAASSSLVKPHSKSAWSLSDRNGLKGKLSAATFITDGKQKRTMAHLAGKDLLGTPKPTSFKLHFGDDPNKVDLFDNRGDDDIIDNKIISGSKSNTLHTLMFEQDDSQTQSSAHQSTQSAIISDTSDNHHQGPPTHSQKYITRRGPGSTKIRKAAAASKTSSSSRHTSDHSSSSYEVTRKLISTDDTDGSGSFTDPIFTPDSDQMRPSIETPYDTRSPTTTSNQSIDVEEDEDDEILLGVSEKDDEKTISLECDNEEDDIVLLPNSPSKR